MDAYKFIHVAAAIVWVGGMFFAYVVLRPAAVAVLQPPERLRLWAAVFQRFFSWVWIAIGLLLVSGLYMVYQYGGIAHSPSHVHPILAGGVLMILVYLYVFFGCYVPFTLRVGKQQWPEAGAILNRIRRWVAFNLTLGTLVTAVAVFGATPG